MFATPALGAENTQWPNYGRDNQLTNSVQSAALTPAAVRKLRPLWATPVNGTVYASPLAAQVDGRELVFVATENGLVYGLSAADGEILWQRTFGTVETESCGSYGVSSTGAIDPARSVLYVVSADGVLHGLDLASGDEVEGFPRTVVTNTAWEYVWGGLHIAGDRLYVPVASYCDEGPADTRFPDGRLISISLSDPEAAESVWEPVAGPGNLGGIWGWGGVSLDPTTGNLYTGIGNSHVWSEACSCYVDDAGYGDQMVELAPDLSAVLGSDAIVLPNTEDDDFGSAPLLFQPAGCPPLAAANNKIGTLYIWNRTRLSRGPIASIPLSDGVAAYIGAPSWSSARQTLYDAQSVLYNGGRLGNGVQALHVEAGCTFRKTWAAVTGDGNQATPLVVGDTVFATGGDPGGFFAFGATDGARLWRAATVGSTVAGPISVQGMIIGADTAGVVYAFDAPPAPALRPSLPPTPWRRVR